ncbi:nuclear intron maturase 4, mitochondrial [Aristolochia californica]|uniref:nuclear intron maturase 4, mitochondrial n=1 Tax=Aristolochia californica TaxID=171875 RepID=UPI0035E34FA3
MRPQFCPARSLGRIYSLFVPTISSKYSMKHIILDLCNMNFSSSSSCAVTGNFLKSRPYSIYSTCAEVINSYRNMNIDQGISSAKKDALCSHSLAKNLACLPDEPPDLVKKSCNVRMELKRLIAFRIKKKVKGQYANGKFHDLLTEVVANPNTLRHAYDSIRLNSNVDLASPSDDLSFAAMAEQLLSGTFNIKANTLSLSTRTRRKEVLVLPNLKLKIVQEAIRIALEVVYRPHFSKISHGCRSGRGHNSALLYICKEVKNANWWFTLPMNQKIDTSILTNLISLMAENIEDNNLFLILHQMLEAKVLNLEFGGFPKGQGLPQEGILSPILMNIYLDHFDKELYKICMRNESLTPDTGNCRGGNKDISCREGNKLPKLRSWFRRQIKDENEKAEENSSLRIWSCRYMDEIFIAISGSKDVALSLKTDFRNYLENSLFLNVDDGAEVYAVDSPNGIQFLGMVLQACGEETMAMKAVHKLKDKVHLFALQKQELWDAGTVRIGKKWLAYGLKKIKESEIQHLADKNSILNQISHLRKDGMKTDHWFKFLLKTWMQAVNAKVANREEEILSKYITEPALPQDLRDSFYNFQKRAQEYVSSETDSTLALLSSYKGSASSGLETPSTKTKVFVPLHYIKKSLLRYGLINSKGFPRQVSALVLLDNIQIINWFSGLSRRWLKWYSECNNFGDIKLIIVEYVRISCIRTLASKHQMDEGLIEKKFDMELAQIPSTEEIEPDMVTLKSDLQLFNEDEALMYGTCNSGLCMLSLSRLRDPSRPCECSVIGCKTLSLEIYSVHVNEKQRFPGWKTGFSTSIHPSMNQRRICLCKKHVEDLFMGYISLQAIDFESLKR